MSRCNRYHCVSSHDEREVISLYLNTHHVSLLHQLPMYLLQFSTDPCPAPSVLSPDTPPGATLTMFMTRDFLHTKNCQVGLSRGQNYAVAIPFLSPL